jgi:VWFA-related protein
MKKGIFIFLIFLLSIFCFLYGFQEQQKLFPPEKHEVEVRLILVDVIVTKGGEFVKDLTEEDFELYEDGIRVPINSFELVSFEERELKIVEEEKEKEKKPPAPPKKKLVVIFDAINSWKREIKLESEKIIDQLFSLAKLGHEVMILQLHRRRGFEILQPFTTNEDFIRKAVQKASGNIWKLGIGIQTPLPPEEAEFLSNGQIEHIKKMTRLEYIYVEQQKFEKTIAGLLSACNMIKNLPGRKSMLLISAGIPDLSPPDMMPKPKLGRSASDLSLENIRVFDPFNIVEKKRFKNGEEVIRELIRFANAQNISLYTLDSDIYVKYLFSGSSAEYYQKSQMAHLRTIEGDKKRMVQNLRWLSEQTGADHLRGVDKFKRFRQVMSSDLTYYYQLSFYPQRKEADDKYHKIKVKVKRRGVEARFRKGYTDYSKEETNKIGLVTAFYNPSLFKKLPFKAEFIPFSTKSGKYEPWMNIALPSKELFRDRFVEYARKEFNFHIWISDKRSREKGYGGEINLPFNITSSFMEFIKNIDYLSFHFKGPELTFKHNEYQAVFALVDPQTNEIGTWESMLSLPDFKKIKEGAFINCVLGEMTSNPKKKAKSFLLSRKDGSLEYGQIKFFPRITNQFANREEASVFLQIYLPQGKKEIHPEFFVKGEDNLLHPISGEVAAESWNEKSKVWSAIFKLDLSSGALGDNSLHVEISVSEGGAVLNKELKLTVLY